MQTMYSNVFFRVKHAIIGHKIPLVVLPLQVVLVAG